MRSHALGWLAGAGQSSSPTNIIPLNAAQPAARGVAPDLDGGKNPNPSFPRRRLIRPGQRRRHAGPYCRPQSRHGPPGRSPDYNGVHDVIPTISVKPGDSFVIDVTNSLVHTKSMADEINIHFHGLGVTPHAPGDDVLGTFAGPGQKIHLRRARSDEPIGRDSTWYHPHIHGEVNYQAGEAGMSGAIIVEGLEHHLPGLGKMKQRLIVVRDTGIGANIVPPHGDTGRHAPA